MLLVVGLISSLTFNIAAQNKVWAEDNQTPKTIGADDVLKNYIDISSLPINKRPQAFSKFSAEDKSNIFKFHLAVQFAKRPNLTNDQKDLILQSISFLSADNYDKTKDRTATKMYSQNFEARISSVFDKKEGFEIFASLGGDVEDLNLIQNYQAINVGDLANRQEVFGRSTPLNKSDFWRIRFLYYLATRSDLNLEQKSLLIEAASYINKDLYINKDKSELAYKQKMLMPLIEKITKAFPDRKDQTIFLFMRDDYAPAEEPGAARCHCLKDSWFSGCGITSTCGKGNACDDNPDNGTHCGFAGLWACDGRCG